MSKKYIVLTLLTISTINAQISHQPAKNNPLELALNMLYKLYTPHKKELNTLRQRLDILSNELVAIEDEFINRISNDNSSKSKESIEEKISEIKLIIKKIAEIKIALDNCPQSLQSENAQNQLKVVGLRYLGQDNPDLVSTQAEEILIIAIQLLQSIQSK